VEEAVNCHFTDGVGLERDLAHDERRPRNRVAQRGGLELIHDSGCVVDTAHTRADIGTVRRHAQLDGIGDNEETRRETHRYLVASRQVTVEIQDDVHGEHRARFDVGRRIRNRIRGRRKRAPRIGCHAHEGQCRYQFLP
jgi:hypothetical protein